MLKSPRAARARVEVEGSAFAFSLSLFPFPLLLFLLSRFSHRDSSAMDPAHLNLLEVSREHRRVSHRVAVFAKRASDPLYFKSSLIRADP